ncbi:MAG: hypothetical protein JWQ09_2461 [Segetibacter sp.]|nr:hypothetical protein [Segetibacter sp.]
MVYTDGAHLTADSLDELYSYANKIGLHPGWIDFMGKTIHPHFNICGHVKQRVLADVSVQKVSCKEIVRLCILNFRLPETDSELGGNDLNDKKRLLGLQTPSDSDFKRMIDNIFKRTGIKRSSS